MFTTILRSFGSWGMGKLGALVMFSALGMLFGMLGRAQVSTASLNGTVTDNTGALNHPTRKTEYPIGLSQNPIN